MPKNIRPHIKIIFTLKFINNAKLKKFSMENALWQGFKKIL